MTITFENDNDVNVYVLEKIIAFAQGKRYIFADHCVWWLASIIGLEQGLIIHIDNLWGQEETRIQSSASVLQASEDAIQLEDTRSQIHPSRIHQMSIVREMSATPRDFTEDQRVEQLSRYTEQFTDESTGARDVTGVYSLSNYYPKYPLILPGLLRSTAVDPIP